MADRDIELERYVWSLVRAGIEILISKQDEEIQLKIFKYQFALHVSNN